MNRHEINVDNKWKIVVYFNVDYNLFRNIEFELLSIGVSASQIIRVHKNMSLRLAKAVTITSYSNKTSVVLFNNHDSLTDYLNSIIHEAEHVKQAMLDYYNISDFGEPPAYTVGFVAATLIQKFLRI